MPKGKLPTFNNNSHELTRVYKSRPLVDQSPSDNCLSMGIRVSFWRPDALPGVQELRIMEETLEPGNLSSVS